MAAVVLTSLRENRDAPGLGQRRAADRGHGWLPWLVSSLLMAVLGGWRVGAAGLGGDELATWVMTQVSALALLGATHVIALSLLAAHGLVVIRSRPDLVRRWVIAAVPGGLPGLALLCLGSRERGQIAWIERADPAALLDYPEKLLGIALLAGLVLALAVLSFSPRWPTLVHASWALIPTGCIFAAGMITPLWTPRYLLFTIPAWVLLAATTLGRVPVRRSVVVLLLVAVIAAPTQLRMRESDGHGQGTREVAALLSERARPGDGIIYSTRTSPWVGRDLLAHYVPAASRPRDLLALSPPRTAGHLVAEECMDVSRCLGGTQRVWVIAIGEFRDPLVGVEERKRKPLTHHRLCGVWHPEGLTLALFC